MQGLGGQCCQMIRNMAAVAAQAGSAAEVVTKITNTVVAAQKLGVEPDVCDTVLTMVRDSCVLERTHIPNSCNLTTSTDDPQSHESEDCDEYQAFVPSSAPNLDTSTPRTAAGTLSWTTHTTSVPCDTNRDTEIDETANAKRLTLRQTFVVTF